MAAITSPLYLCADGGGTSVTVAIASIDLEVVAKGQSGPCNVKTVGPIAALTAIIEAACEALNSLGISYTVDWHAESGAPSMRYALFKGVWLGLAGIGPQEDVDAFSSYASRAFRLPLEEGQLKVTNDCHLLASPCSSLPCVQSVIALVAGTGSVAYSFKRVGKEFVPAGIRGGWGYLLGDEGSAYNIGRRAIRSILMDNDIRESEKLVHPERSRPKLLPFYGALLDHLGVPSCAALVDRTYSNHSPTSLPISIEKSEAARKVWISEVARVVFSFAFGGEADKASTQIAYGIAKQAAQELVEMAANLVGDRTSIDPSTCALSLGGGLWVPGYRQLLTEGLRTQHEIVFAEVLRVEEPAEAGVRALVAHASTQ